MNLGGVIYVNKKVICLLCGALLLLLLYMISNNNAFDGSSGTVGHKVNLNHLLKTAIKAAQNGGAEVVAKKDHLKIKSKGLTKEGMQDSVTTADYLSHCSIMRTLKHYFPDLHVVSEEAATKCKDDQKIDFLEIRDPQIDSLDDQLELETDVTVWIDPLDATHEYTEKLYQYVTTMVCVAVKGRPVIGVIHKPFVQDNGRTTWAWVGKGKSSNLKQWNNSDDKLKIIISRSHSGDIRKILGKKMKKDYELVIAAGAGYKALEVATGGVDAYLHTTAIKKWDVCAGNAIIEAVGGKMTTKFGELLDYSDFTNVQNERGLVATLKNHELFMGDRYLFYTNMGISVTLSCAGDVLQQNYEILTNTQETWDKTRTRNMSFYGLVVGAMCHHWYVFLDRRLPGYKIQVILKKIVVDQVVCSPITVLTLFVTTGLLERKSRQEVWTEIKQKAWILYTAEWVVWPAAQFINFYFLPTRFRVFYDNTVSLGYDVYTSYIKHDKS